MDGIFTDEEIKANEATQATELTPHEPAEQGGQDRPRGPDGKFLPKDEAAPAPVEAVEGEEKGGTVPQQALHAEREKRKQSDQERDAAKAELTRLQEQLGAIQKMREQVASRRPEDLPAADDPAALEHLRRRLAETEQTVTRVTQGMDDARLVNEEVQQLGGYMSQAEARLREQKPDYDEAIDHIVKARAAELELYGLSPAQIQQTISQEAVDVIRTAVQQNRDPAALAYSLAQARGYRPAEGGGRQPEAKPNGGGAQAMLDAIENAKKASKSLGSGGGAAVKTLTAEAVAALSGEEFEAIYATPEGKAMIDAL
jgi:hypothetical protein